MTIRLPVVVLAVATSVACGRQPTAVTDTAGTTPPSVTSLSWANRQVALGSDRLTSFCCLDPIAYMCAVQAPDTPTVTIYLSFQDQPGACATPRNCWVHSRVASLSGGTTSALDVTEDAPLKFTPSVLTCWAANARGYVSAPAVIRLDVPRGIGP